uniref:CSON008223 protein n=2 Tax=Culicoides sonorensis TaxID=179676 RepID=A0A336LKH6_CULSO
MSTPVTPPDRIQTSETTEVQISSVNANTNNTSDSPTFPFSSIRINWRENLTSNISNMIQEFRPIFDPSITYLTTNQNESLVLNLENNETEMTSPNYSQDEHIPDTNLRIQTEEDDFNGPTNQNNLSEAFASIPDAVLRQEITKQDQRSFSPLIRELIFIIIVLGVIGFMLQKKNVPLSLLVALPIDEEFTLKRLLFAAVELKKLLVLFLVDFILLSSICPLCRATVSDNPNYKDGSTSLFLQLY